MVLGAPPEMEAALAKAVQAAVKAEVGQMEGTVRRAVRAGCAPRGRTGMQLDQCSASRGSSEQHLELLRLIELLQVVAHSNFSGLGSPGGCC